MIRFSNVLSIAVVLACLFAPARLSATPILVEGKATDGLATAIGELTLSGNVLTLTLKNTSAYDGRITGIGFDLFAGDSHGPGGLNGYSGNLPGKFTFRDGDLKNVPEFNTAILDFGWTTGKSGHFNSGKADDGMAPQSSLTFTVTGPFFGLSEEQLARALYVRFQQIGPDGEGSDTGRGQVTEPATMLLVGAGVLVVVRRVRRRWN